MDLSQRLSISYYKTVAAINESHRVYLCQHIETGRICVRKELDVYSAEVYRHLKDAPVPGLPQIYELYEEDGVLTVIEEYAPGRTLQEIMDARELSAAQILKYMLLMCGILEKLHNHVPPLIHRDLKPSNVMITGLDNVVILDMNAAKFCSGEAARGSDTVLLGTKGYAAPEQYGFRESSPQTDIYALGVILREACDSLEYYDHELDPIIGRCTRLEPAQRYASVAELRSELEKHSGWAKSDRQPDATGAGPVDPGSAGAGLASFAPPGFRTGTLWKMLLALPIYILALWAILFSPSNQETGFPNPGDRAVMLIAFFGTVMIAANYRGIRDSFPLCKSDKPGLRILGTLIAIALFLFAMMLLMVSLNIS